MIKKPDAKVYIWRLMRTVELGSSVELARGSAPEWHLALRAIEARIRLLQTLGPTGPTYGLINEDGNWRCTGPP